MADYNSGHPTTAAVPDDVALLDTVVYEDIAGTCAGPYLSTAEAAHFKAHGFVVKRRLIDDSELFAQVIDYLWQQVPRKIICRDDPDSWLDKPHEKWTEEDHERVGLMYYGNWKLRSQGPSGIGTERFLVEGIARHPAMLQMAEAFLGAPVKRPDRVRGIYAILPKPGRARGAYGPHADYMAAQLSAMVVADHMPPGSGGFTVWPGSHERLHLHWDTCFGSGIGKDKAEGYRLARDEVLRSVAPLEMHGEPGDVIFWHPRLLHSAGINHSAEWHTPLVRTIVPVDYQRADHTCYDDLAFGPGPKYQWWLDTRNFREDVPPTPHNLWHDWVFTTND